MEIREARLDDLDSIMGIYDYARAYMAENGNPTQWNDGYPSRELLESDIKKGQCYVCAHLGEVHGVFVLMTGTEPTYSVIENGGWKSDAPYGTLHRLAGDGKAKGIARLCIDFCKSRLSHLRADTHHDNRTMQHILEKNGFESCGIIYVRDGSPRIAYEYIRY